jgi:hypothetical protein
MAPILAFVLVVRIALYPDLPPITIGAYETQKECEEAGRSLDQTTRVILKMTCEIRI